MQKDPRTAGTAGGMDHLREQAATMFVSRLLERVREALLGRRTPGKHRRAVAPSAPRLVTAVPSPDVWGARLRAARRHRARHAPVTVRPYVRASLGEEWRTGARQ